MKRLILLIIVAMLVYWVWARERSALMRPSSSPSGHRNGPHFVQDREARKHLAKAGREVHRALREAKQEIRHAVGKTHDEIQPRHRRGTRGFRLKMMTMATCQPRSGRRSLSVRKPKGCRSPSCRERG